jgi:hypothetical protein
MLNIQGRINKNGEIVLQQGQKFNQDSPIEENSNYQPSGINIEFAVTIDIGSLILGINGFVWATKDFQQAQIIGNALKVQSFEVEIVKVELEVDSFYLLQVTHKKDIKEVIDFIYNDKGGLRLKLDWIYPEGEPNKSFEKWL